MRKSKKKVNPHRRPATAADISKAKREAQEYAITAAWAIFFRVMRDKFGFGEMRLRKLWEYVNDYSDAISRGELKVEEIVKTLEEEDGIVLK